MSLRHYPYGFNKQYNQFKLSNEAQSAATRMAAGGFNLSYDQRKRIDDILKTCANNGGQPILCFDSQVSIDTSNAANTKIWNLGSSGATNDGTLTNGTAGDSTTTVGGKTMIAFTTTKRIELAASVTYGASVTVIMRASPSSTTDSYMIGGGSGNNTPAFLSGYSSRAYEYFNNNGGSQRSTIQLTTSGLNNIAFAQTDGSNFKSYFNGGVIDNLTPTLTVQNRSLNRINTAGAGLGGGTYNFATILVFNSKLTDQQIANIMAVL